MTPEQWALVERLYHEAASISIAERGSWLARACGGDEVVQREVESLLTQNASATAVLDGHALDLMTPAAVRESLVGRQLGGYEFLSLIDEGGMGQVYRARDLTLPRDVAVKVVSPEFTHDAVRRSRFRKEAEVLAGFAHPHIAHIYSFVEAEGRFLLAMELVPGDSLAARIARGPLRVSEALDIAGQVADALDAAHEQGVVHRDLKPANIRITPDGVVKVLDFGLATTARPASAAAATTLTRTAPGTLLGTVAYMSPEQARGEAVDKRTDIWAFGCVLFEMLTGVRLFGSTSTAETLALVMTQEIDWSRLPAHVPTVVRALLKRCLERDQRKRLGDVAAIRFALEDVARTAISDARANEAGEDVAQESPRRQAPALTLIRNLRARQRNFAAAAVVLAIVAATWVFSRGAAPQDSQLSLPQGNRLTTTGNATLAAISPDGNTVAYVERSNDGDSLLIRQTTTGKDQELVGPGIRILAVTMTPDSQWVDYVTGETARNTLWRVSSFAGKPKRLIDGVDSAIAWSPDARQFAFLRLNVPRVDKTALMLADADGSNVRELNSQIVVEDRGRKLAVFQLVPPPGPPRPAWSPDGATIAVPAISYPDRTGLVMFVTVSNGSEQAVRVNPAGSGGAWVDDATLLWSMAAVGGGPRQLYSLSYPSGRSLRLTTDLSDYAPASVSEQRDAFATVQADPERDIWIRDESGVESILNTSAASPLGGVVAPLAWVGDQLLYAAQSGDRRGLWVADAVNQGNDAEEWVRRARVPSASADGNVIIYLSGVQDAPNTLWKANREGRDARQVATGVLWPVIHPTGDQAVFVRPAPDGVVTLWRVALDSGNSEEIAHVNARNPDISTDGRWLAFVTSKTGPDGVARQDIGICELQNCSSTVRSLTAPGVLEGATPIRWTSDDTGVAYVYAAGEQNIWIQPLKGQARQVTRFTDGRTIQGFAWSRFGKKLAVQRERVRTDVVLFRGLLTRPTVQNP